MDRDSSTGGAARGVWALRWAPTINGVALVLGLVLGVASFVEELAWRWSRERAETVQEVSTARAWGDREAAWTPGAALDEGEWCEEASPEEDGAWAGEEAPSWARSPLGYGL